MNNWLADIKVSWLSQSEFKNHFGWTGGNYTVQNTNNTYCFRVAVKVV